MPTDTLEARITTVETRLDDLDLRVTEGLKKVETGQDRTNDRLLLLDGRLARIEAIEKAQLDALLASSAWKVTAAKAIGSGVARGCESMAAATASPKVQIGVIALLALWIMGHYELVGKFGDYVEIGNSAEEQIPGPRTEARPAP